MNFELTEERRMLQDTLRRYLANAPNDAQCDTQRDIKNNAKNELWTELAELGVIGALFNEEAGGFGGTGFDLMVVFEELGRGDTLVPLIDNALLPGLLVLAAGADVTKLIAGTERLAFAHSELELGGDPRQWRSAKWRKIGGCRSQYCRRVYCVCTTLRHYRFTLRHWFMAHKCRCTRAKFKPL